MRQTTRKNCHNCCRRILRQTHTSWPTTSWWTSQDHDPWRRTLNLTSRGFDLIWENTDIVNNLKSHMRWCYENVCTVSFNKFDQIKKRITFSVNSYSKNIDFTMLIDAARVIKFNMCLYNMVFTVDVTSVKIMNVSVAVSTCLQVPVVWEFRIMSLNIS